MSTKERTHKIREEMITDKAMLERSVEPTYQNLHHELLDLFHAMKFNYCT